MLMSLMMAKKDKGREIIWVQKADVQTTLSCLENIPFCLSVRPYIRLTISQWFLRFFFFSLTNRSTQITNCCCCYWCFIQRSKHIYSCRYSRQVSAFSAHSTARNVCVLAELRQLVSRRELWQPRRSLSLSQTLMCHRASRKCLSNSLNHFHQF